MDFMNVTLEKINNMSYSDLTSLGVVYSNSENLTYLNKEREKLYLLAKR